MARFGDMDNTNPVLSPQANPDMNIPRSAFNLSRMHNFNANIGTLIPFDVIQTNPNEDYTISYDTLAIVRNPLVRRLQSGMRIYIHTYYCKMADLWEGWQNFITKGRSGTIDKSVPKLKYTYKNKDGNTVNALTPMSVADYIGIPPMYYDSSVPREAYLPVNTSSLPATAKKVGESADYYNALPFMMYQKICRDKYFNSNLLQDNKKWFPDNESHFILSYACTEANVIDYEHENNTSNLGTQYGVNDEIHVPIGDSTPPVLTAMHYRQFKGDYFNTALPFPDLIRGNKPVLNLGSIITGIDWTDVLASSAPSTSARVMFAYGEKKLFGGASITGPDVPPTPSDNYGSAVQSGLKETLDKAKISATLQSTVDLNGLRALEAYTIFSERMARTDGSYNQMISSQYNVSPHFDEREPIYIGGTYQDIVFNEIIQTSETSTTPLGTSAGRGASANSGFIGKFHSNDYGYIMSIMSIVPDTMYTQGVDKFLTRHLQTEFYFPILNNLGAEPILNKELFISGNATNDNDIFGWSERTGDYKSRQSTVSGLMQLSHTDATYDASTIMARRFTSTPQLNNKFVTMSPQNIDNAIFTYANEPPFDISVACRVDAVRPMPYITVPGGLAPRA